MQNLRQLQINQQQQSLQAATSGNIIFVSQPRGAQKRQHSLYLHMGLQAVKGKELRPSLTLLSGSTIACRDKVCKYNSGITKPDDVSSSCSHNTAHYRHGLAVNLNVQNLLYNYTNTHRGKHTNLVFQSSSDFERFLRAVLCFSSSLFFSSLARS